MGFEHVVDPVGCGAQIGVWFADPVPCLNSIVGLVWAPWYTFSDSYQVASVRGVMTHFHLGEVFSTPCLLRSGGP